MATRRVALPGGFEGGLSPPYRPLPPLPPLAAAAACVCAPKNARVRPRAAPPQPFAHERLRPCARP